MGLLSPPPSFSPCRCCLVTVPAGIGDRQQPNSLYYSPSRPSPAGLEAPTLYLHLYVLQLLRQLKSLKKKFRAASYRFSSSFALCKLLSPFFLRLKVHFVQDGCVRRVQIQTDLGGIEMPISPSYRIVRRK